MPAAAEPDPAETPINIASFTDGTSNTVIFSEWVRGDGIPPGSGSKDGLGQIYVLNDPDHQGQPFAGQQNAGASRRPGVPGRASYLLNNGNRWTWKGDWWISSRSNTYSHTQTPNRKSCYFGDTQQDISMAVNVVAASSRHPGGVNTAFGDGSVRFIKDTINNTVWWGLSTPKGGEVLSSDSY